MDTTESGIPTGPIDREPTGFRPTDEKEAILTETLLAAGLRLGDYDERIVRWFAQYADWSTFAVITSWVQRAGERRP